jgi:aspartokinase/homoserine dehydrogenase 1
MRANRIDKLEDGPESGGGAALSLVGLASSRRGLLDQSGITIPDWQQHLAESDHAAAAVVGQALELGGGHKIFVDCTASEEVSAQYEDLLASGTSVVAANKRAFSESMGRYRALKKPGAGGARAYFETTVGAGLPVLRTIRDLVATGDEIVSVEGVFSGTLGFLLGEVMAGQSFSEALAEARRLAYTEPDPREDLSGQDMLRKLVIVARVAGMVIEPAEVDVELLLPGESWQEGGVDEFMDRTRELDEVFTQRRTGAIEQGGYLCFLGSVSRESATATLTAVTPEHPCYGLGVRIAS